MTTYAKTYLFVIIVVITLKQEVSKNYWFLFLVLSICFTNLCPKLPGFLGSSYDGEFRLPLVLAQASPIFHSSCEGKLGIALE